MAYNVVASTASCKKATFRGRATPKTASTSTPFTPWVVEGQETQVVVRNTFVQCVLPPPPGASTRSKSSPARFEVPKPESRPNAVAAGRKRGGTRSDARKRRQTAEQKVGARRGRWWEESLEICAVSGFPIRLLPYPPFRLKVPSGECYVDGQFLAAKMIAEWTFEANGTPLSTSSLHALDAYISRCKLPRALIISDAKADHAESAKGSCVATRRAEARTGFAAAKLRDLQEIQLARTRKLRREGAAVSKQAQTLTASQPRPPMVSSSMQVLFVPARVLLFMPGGSNLTAVHGVFLC